MALYAIKDLSDERIAFLYGAPDHRFNQKLRVLFSAFIFACEKGLERLREFLRPTPGLPLCPGLKMCALNSAESSGLGPV